MATSTVDHIFATIRDVNSPQAAFNFKIRRREGSLRKVKELVNALLGSKREAVTQLLVVGSEGDAEEKSTVDLFQDRMIEPLRIELAEGDRITNAVRYDCLKEAFRAR